MALSERWALMPLSEAMDEESLDSQQAEDGRRPAHAGTSMTLFHAVLEAHRSGPSVTQAGKPRIPVRAQSRTRPPAGDVRGSFSVKFMVVSLSRVRTLTEM